MKRALLSVSDKTGLLELARGLSELGIELISTGGTARALQMAGISVTPIEEVTGVAEMLGGRVKTLHPKIHGGILARRDLPSDMLELQTQGIGQIDLVVANLYPFEQTVARADVTLAEAIEQIDIGGVTLLRAAAKNYHDVIILSEPADYWQLLEALRQSAQISNEFRQRLAIQAFQATARYDAAISRYLSSAQATSFFPEHLAFSANKGEEMRYGENPHQRAALYQLQGAGGLAHVQQLHGKGMSYTNWLDAEGAWSAVQGFKTPAVVIVKHASPCGVATNQSLVQAWQDALACDSVSAFGGVVAVNRAVDVATAQAINEIFTEILLAPDFEPDALELLKSKKNRRLLRVPPFTGTGMMEMEVRGIPGGFVVQQRDVPEAEIKMQQVSQRAATSSEQAALAFAWQAIVGVKSNAIVFACAVHGGFATVGIGTGQPSRVDAVELAVKKAGVQAKGAVMASDAFFPFPDGVQAAIRAGITAIIHPGGSVRDDLVIAAANQHHIAMVTTGVRHFRH